jgi:hypothetical protein
MPVEYWMSRQLMHCPFLKMKPFVKSQELANSLGVAVVSGSCLAPYNKCVGYADR